MFKKTALIVVVNILLFVNIYSCAKYVFKETLSVARLDTGGNYYLITYTERTDPTEKIEKVYKDEKHDKDGSILKKWIMDKRTTLETIKIEDTSGDIEDLSYLFGGSNEIMVCLYLTKIDLSNFNTENVTNMTFMFYDCVRLVELDISSLDTSNVEDMSYMFFYCSSIENLNLRSFDTKKVTNMDYMFCRCSKLKEIQVSNKWKDTSASKVSMFKNSGVSSVTLYN